MYRPMTAARAAATATAALLPLPSAALTPAEAWAAWQATAGEGVILTAASETDSGGDLLVEGVEILFAGPEDGEFEQDVRVTIDSIRFADLGGGRVGITLPDSFPVVAASTPAPEDGETPETFSVTFDIGQQGLDLVASGTPDSIGYDYDADALTATLSDMQDTSDDEVELTLDMSMTDVDGAWGADDGQGTFTAARLTIDAGGSGIPTEADDEGDGGGDTAGTGEGGSFTLTARTDNIQSVTTGGLGLFSGSDAIVAMLQSDETASSSLSYGPIEYTLAFDDPASGDTSITGGSDRATVSARFGEGSIAYEGRTDGGRFAVAGSAIPFPELTMASETSSWSAEMPLAPSDTAQPFGLSMNLAGVTLGEGVWSMFDPAGQLPRDPASLTLALSGEGRWDVDIFDPQAVETMADGTPGEIESVSIDTIGLDLLGVVLDGSGAFTFGAAADGTPVPEGAIDLTLTGAEALIDTLVQMGMVPEDQAMGARMMLGLFARPTDTPGTLESKIEFGADGSISANGQRLR